MGRQRAPSTKLTHWGLPRASGKCGWHLGASGLCSLPRPSSSDWMLFYVIEGLCSQLIAPGFPQETPQQCRFWPQSPAFSSPSSWGFPDTGCRRLPPHALTPLPAHRHGSGPRAQASPAQTEICTEGGRGFPPTRAPVCRLPWGGVGAPSPGRELPGEQGPGIGGTSPEGVGVPVCGSMLGLWLGKVRLLRPQGRMGRGTWRYRGSCQPGTIAAGLGGQFPAVATGDPRQQPAGP